MTQEQKAKAYDEALERARKLYEQGTITESLCYVFPELKESEDERTRKAILNYFTKCWGNCKDNVCGVHVEDAIAWLEKQGKQEEPQVYEIEEGHGSPAKVKEVSAELFKLAKLEQKLAWSEEDEIMYREIHNLIYSTPYCDSRKELSDFLNSLKNRLQSILQQKWSEEDKKMFVNIKAYLRNVNKDYSRELDWLKSLRQRYLKVE